MGLFNERRPLNQREEYRIENGTLAEQVSVHKRPADVVREIEVCLLLSRQSAETLRDWLNKAIAAFDERKRSMESEQGA